MHIPNMMRSSLLATAMLAGHGHGMGAHGGTRTLDALNTSVLDTRDTCPLVCMPKLCTDEATIRGAPTTLTYLCPKTATTVSERHTIYVTVTEFTTVTPTVTSEAKPTVPPTAALGVSSAKPAPTIILNSTGTIIKTIDVKSKYSSVAFGSMASGTDTKVQASYESCSATAGVAISRITTEELEEIVHSTTTSTTYVTLTLHSLSSESFYDTIEETSFQTLTVPAMTGFLPSPGSTFNSSIFVWPTVNYTSYLSHRYGSNSSGHTTDIGNDPAVTSTTYVSPNATTSSPHKSLLSNSLSASAQSAVGHVGVSLVRHFIGLVAVVILV